MFDRLVDAASAAIWNLMPSWAVYLGKHEYDGVLPDVHPDAVATSLSRLAGLRGQITALDGLTETEELDRLQLNATIDGLRHDYEHLRWWQRNPMGYVNALDVTTYLNRSYAPLPQRAARIADLLEDAPAFLAQAKANIDGPVPAVYRRWTAATAQGLAGFFRDGLPLDDVRDAGVAARVGETAAQASDALFEYAAWAEEALAERGDADFAVGGGALEEMLRRSELLEMPLEELLALGEEDLARNLESFAEAAASVDATLTPREVYDRHVASVHPTADQLIPATRDMLEEIRSFLIEHDVISVPSEVRAGVAETPEHLRWAFAMMDTPGPYETQATEAYYYVTPVDPSWPAEQAEEWLRALNTFTLLDISVHETYPGHYVHFLHYKDAPSEVTKRTWSYAFTEGWAHYTEQMMIEEGFHADDPRYRLAYLTEALVRNCRFVCAIKMHTGEMSVDEATDFFKRNANYDETPARKEAERGTFDPGYFSYTLGKLQILRLRDDYRAAQGSAFSLKEFHDRLLSRGAPPVELMRRVLLPG